MDKREPLQQKSRIYKMRKKGTKKKTQDLMISEKV